MVKSKFEAAELELLEPRIARADQGWEPGLTLFRIPKCSGGRVVSPMFVDLDVVPEQAQDLFVETWFVQPHFAEFRPVRRVGLRHVDDLEAERTGVVVAAVCEGDDPVETVQGFLELVRSRMRFDRECRDLKGQGFTSSYVFHGDCLVQEPQRDHVEQVLLLAEAQDLSLFDQELHQISPVSGDESRGRLV